MEEAPARHRAVTLRYFDGCPHWRFTYDLLRAALRKADMADVEPVLEQVETEEDAQRLRFIGSPTILIDGRDPFAEPQASYGLTCRLYRTPEGLAGSPTPEQFRAALLGA